MSNADYHTHSRMIASHRSNHVKVDQAVQHSNINYIENTDNIFGKYVG